MRGNSRMKLLSGHGARNRAGYEAKIFFPEGSLKLKRQHAEVKKAAKEPSTFIAFRFPSITFQSFP